MKNVFAASALGAACAISPVIAQAGSDTLRAQTAATQSTEATIDAIVENGRTNDDGVTYPATGRATPVENWFGCKPGNEKDACARGGQAMASAKEDDREMGAETSADAGMSFEAETRSETDADTRGQNNAAMTDAETDADAGVSVDADVGVRVQ